jgi:hypothetical protein
MLTHVFVFQNGLVAVFDSYGKQIPMLQGRWDDVKDKVIPAIEASKAIVEIKDALGVVWPLLADNPFCHPDCGYYCDAGKTCPCMKCYLFWHNNTYPPAAYLEAA